MNPNEDKFTEFTLENVAEEIKFIETYPVQEGVECDSYEFVSDRKRDLTVYRVAAGFKTSLQLVLKGERTIEGFISGKGILYVTPSGHSDEVAFEFEDGGVNEPIVIEIGDIMQWVASEESDLTFYEICEPPYADGRFEDLPEPEEQ